MSPKSIIPIYYFPFYVLLYYYLYLCQNNVNHVPKLLNMKVFKSALLTKIDLNP